MRPQRLHFWILRWCWGKSREHTLTANELLTTPLILLMLMDLPTIATASGQHLPSKSSDRITSGLLMDKPNGFLLVFTFLGFSVASDCCCSPLEPSSLLGTVIEFSLFASYFSNSVLISDSYVNFSFFHPCALAPQLCFSSAPYHLPPRSCHYFPAGSFCLGWVSKPFSPPLPERSL